MINLIKSAWKLVRENWKAYLVINAVYYGLVIICMIYVAFNQELQGALLKQIGASFTSGPLAFVGKSYASAQVAQAILVTFCVNLFLGSVAEITLPSLIIPFSGLLMGVFRAALWGLLLSPAHPDLRLVMIPHSLTLLIEGQAYILVMLATYIQGRAFLFPKTVGLESHAKGYWEGLKRTGKIYVLVTLTLAIAAIYEVIEVIFLAKLIS